MTAKVYIKLVELVPGCGMFLLRAKEYVWRLWVFPFRSNVTFAPGDQPVVLFLFWICDSLVHLETFNYRHHNMPKGERNKGGNERGGDILILMQHIMLTHKQ